MGVLYSVALLDDDIKPWLRDEGVAFTEPHTPSRFPTPRELRQLPDIFDDLKVSLNTRSWDIMFEGKSDPQREPWTLLHVSHFKGDENVPHSIWFEKG